MSAKWVRSKAWERQHLTGPLTPVRWILHTFSTIWFAVTLMVAIALYGAVASVPIGLWALAPTYLFYAATWILVVGTAVGLPLWLARGALRRIKSPGNRFVVRLLAVLALGAFGAWAWREALWPMLRYVPAGPDGEARGVRFFADFVAANQSRLLRQLPSWEMSELEYYGWWPFRLVLFLFVLNLIVATVRRIEFKWINIGVLTVHTGIVLIAVGSIAYRNAKLEGSMLLIKGGLPNRFFYDNIRPAVYAWPEGRASQFMMPLDGLPRYNPAPPGSEHAPRLALHEQPGFETLFPDDLEIEVTGVVPYGDVVNLGWIEDRASNGSGVNPSINVTLEADRETNGQTEAMAVLSERLIGRIPAEGTLHTQPFTVQHLPFPAASRVEALKAEFSQPGEHALIVRVPAAGFERIYTVKPGDRIDVGDTGWTITVNAYQASDQGLSIVTRGYEGAQSSRLLVSLTGPGGQAFDRHVMHRYPELTQDFHPTPAGERPRRTPPDPAIDLTYLDATKTHWFLVQPDPALPTFEVIRREPGGAVHVETVREGDRLSGGEMMGLPVFLKLSDFWARTRRHDTVEPTPEDRQEKDFKGNWGHGYLAIELRAPQPDGSTWSRTEWLPFNQFLDFDPHRPELGRVIRPVAVPGVGTINLAFGRLRLMLPDIQVQLADFEMIPYPGTQTPRDYVSRVVVTNLVTGQEERHEIRLNRPYIHRETYRPREEFGAITNLAVRLRSLVLPNRFKFSQAGWDPENQSFTVLGVGNNLGIHVIALGGILMAVGIPWAFYVKPAILRHRKKKIQAQLAAGTYPLPARAATGAGATETSPEPQKETVGARR